MRWASSQAQVRHSTYSGGPWCLLMQFPAMLSGCHSLAGKCLHWGKCQYGPRVSECRCCGLGSLWCWCAERLQIGHHLGTECFGHLHVQRWGQQDPNLENRHQFEGALLCMVYVGSMSRKPPIKGGRNIFKFITSVEGSTYKTTH